MIEASRRLVLSAIVCACMAPAAAEEQPSLQPYQMVRSLQLLQDQLAAGDHAALPMQRKLLELIDARLRDADAAVYSEKRNVRAVLIYGMSGGNPATLAEIQRRNVIPEGDRKLLKGVLAYLHGNPHSAQTALGETDPGALPPELGAFVALVNGSVTAGSDPNAALRQFDLARLLGPGTLVEEAAIRRSLAIEASSGQAERFFRAAAQYVRRFLRSPYASQFADSFVTGVLELREHLDYEAMDRIASMMDADQSEVIYLRIARRAAIEGLTELSAYASARAGKSDVEDPQDPRVQLYAVLSNLTSENVESVAASLARVDRRQLAQSDIRLLEAAERLAAEMIARPTLETTSALSPEKKQVAPAEPTHSPRAEPDSPPSPQTGQAASEPADAQPIPGPPDPGGETQAAAAPPVKEPAAPDNPTDVIVSETRAKLNAIDKLLEDAR